MMYVAGAAAVALGGAFLLQSGLFKKEEVPQLIDDRPPEQP